MEKYAVRAEGSRYAVYKIAHNTIWHTFSTIAKATAYCAKLNKE